MSRTQSEAKTLNEHTNCGGSNQIPTYADCAPSVVLQISHNLQRLAGSLLSCIVRRTYLVCVAIVECCVGADAAAAERAALFFFSFALAFFCFELFHSEKTANQNKKQAAAQRRRRRTQLFF